MTTNNMTGLKQRKTFEEVIDYIQNDKTKIKYPDRTAKFLRNSFELSQLDNAGMMLMEQQQFREMKEREKEHLLRQLVANTGKSITEARATHTDDSASVVSADLPQEPVGDIAEEGNINTPSPTKNVNAGVISPVARLIGLFRPEDSSSSSPPVSSVQAVTQPSGSASSSQNPLVPSAMNMFRPESRYSHEDWKKDELLKIARDKGVKGLTNKNIPEIYAVLSGMDLVEPRVPKPKSRSK